MSKQDLIGQEINSKIGKINIVNKNKKKKNAFTRI
jgi:hypothetical protein